MSEYCEISFRVVRARKNYLCEWCNEKIDVGSFHPVRRYKWEGELVTGRLHRECYESMEKSSHDIVSDGWMPGDFKRGEIAT